MKKLLLILITIMMLCTLCACGEPEEKPVYDNTNAYVIDIEEDMYGNVINRTVYNNITEQTYVYTYTYTYHNGMWECTNVDVVVILRGGTVIYPKE